MANKNNTHTHTHTHTHKCRRAWLSFIDRIYVCYTIATELNITGMRAIKFNISSWQRGKGWKYAVHQREELETKSNRLQIHNFKFTSSYVIKTFPRPSPFNTNGGVSQFPPPPPQALSLASHLPRKRGALEMRRVPATVW